MKPNANSSPRISRRNFLNSATRLGLGAAVWPAIVPASVFGAAGRPAPGNRITLGVIGTGNQGTNDTRAFLADERVQVLAVCDVNRESPGYWNGAVAGRDPAKRLVENHYAQQTASGGYKGCDAYVDFREVLDRRDIDAVLIVTPDHWHAIPTILAAKAGKDIYCQKPLGLTIAEGRAMCQAIKKYHRIFQCGSQQRSDRLFRHACELVRNYRIGPIHTVKCGLPSGHPDYGKTGNRKAPEPVPEGFDYDRWLGPAPDAPYAPARCHVNFRWNLDYSGGQLTDWGGHHIDIAQWGLGTEETGPVQIVNAKGTFPPRTDLWNTATEFSFEAKYHLGPTLIVSTRNRGGVTFEGKLGWIWVNRGAYDCEPKSVWRSEVKPGETRLYKSDNHYRNFIDCVISREQPIAPCEVAHRSITIAHLGNIAMQLETDFKWHPYQEKVRDNAEANTMLSRPYREPWVLPS